MPQPLSRVRSQVGIVSFANVGDYPLRRHPDLAVLLAEAITSWATVDSFMLHLYVHLMGGAMDRAATAFLSLETQSAKTAAINAVARQFLSDDRRALLNAIMRLAKSCQSNRDRLVHWLWGDSSQINDGLLLVNPKDVVNESPNPDLILVYKEKDFHDIIAANERLARYGLRFIFILRDHQMNEGNAIYDQLCAEPEIRERLHRQA
jgi:hypothetical protein